MNKNNNLLHKLLLVVIASSIVSLSSGCQSEHQTTNNTNNADITQNSNLNINLEVEDVEKQSDTIHKRLETEELNQSEMNLLAEQIYVLWDDELNKVWGYLKDVIDKDTMASLTSIQKEWIVKKENEINRVGSEYEGGSMRPMIEYLKGAELTRERVYELVELLSK